MSTNVLLMKTRISFHLTVITTTSVCSKNLTVAKIGLVGPDFGGVCRKAEAQRKFSLIWKVANETIVRLVVSVNSPNCSFYIIVVA